MTRVVKPLVRLAAVTAFAVALGGCSTVKGWFSSKEKEGEKPVDPADYTVAFTPTEWSRLQAAFPAGVCDWSKPGVGQQALAGTWLSFGPAPANLVQK